MIGTQDSQRVMDNIIRAYKKDILPNYGEDRDALASWGGKVLRNMLEGTVVEIQRRDGKFDPFDPTWQPHQTTAYILRKSEKRPETANGDYAHIKVVPRPIDLRDASPEDEGKESYEIAIVVTESETRTRFSIPLSEITALTWVSDEARTVEEKAQEAKIEKKALSAVDHYRTRLLTEYQKALGAHRTASEAREGTISALTLAEARYAKKAEEYARKAIEELRPQAEVLTRITQEREAEVESAYEKIRSWAIKELTPTINGIPLRIETEAGSYNMTVSAAKGKAVLHMNEEGKSPLVIDPKPDLPLGEGFFPIALEDIVDIRVLEAQKEKKRDSSGERRAYNEQIDDILRGAHEKMMKQKEAAVATH